MAAASSATRYTNHHQGAGRRTYLAGLFLVVVASRSSCTFVEARLRKGDNPWQRDISIQNDSGGTINVYWIHPDTKELFPSLGDKQSEEGVVYGSDVDINSFVGHDFEIQEMPSAMTGKCYKGRDCQKAYFTVTTGEDQRITVDKSFQVTIEDSKTKAEKMAKEALQGCMVSDTTLSPAQQIDLLASCLEKRMNATVTEKQSEIVFDRDLRYNMGDRLEKYICWDDKKNTSHVVLNRTWTYQYDTGSDVDTEKVVEYDVKVLFETERSSLFLVKEFMSEEECRAILEASTGTSKETVRTLPLQARKASLVVANAVAKMEKLASFALNAPIEYNADPMMDVVTTSGSSIVDSANSQECVMNEQDGTCEKTVASSEELSKQVAPTLVVNTVDSGSIKVICAAPESGGAMHFKKAGAHVNPREAVGSAVFMRYTSIRQDGRPREEEPFIEEHLECPVQKGNLVVLKSNFRVL